MKHTYTDQEIQAAINAALNSSGRPRLFTTEVNEPEWTIQQKSRGQLAKKFLARLPEPQPHTADGKTPGQVDYEATKTIGGNRAWLPWDQLKASSREMYEAGAQSVLAAFGGALESAIARMEAVPWPQSGSAPAFTCAQWSYAKERLIAAAREGKAPSQPAITGQHGPAAMPPLRGPGLILEPTSQPQEIPWTEWHGGTCPLKDEVEEWEWKLRSGHTHVGNHDIYTPQGRKWNHLGDDLDIIAYRVTKWREGFGPAVVDWKAKYEEAQAQANEFKRIGQGFERDARNHFEQSCTNLQRAEKAEELAATEKRKRLYAEEQLGILAKTFGYEGRTWCNMVSYLCPRLQKAEAELAEAKKILQQVDLPEEPLPVQAQRMKDQYEWQAGIARVNERLAHPQRRQAMLSKMYPGLREQALKQEYGCTTHFAEPSPAELVKPWTPAVGDVVTKANPVQDMALGGQMYWRDLARQLAEVWWKCHNIGASLQHGDIDTDVLFSVVCEKHGGQCFHADTPHNAWLKAEKWLISPDRANFPAATLQLA